MSDATIITLADAVADAIGDAAWSKSLTARRAYVTRAKLEAIGDLTVLVSPTGHEQEAGDRSGDDHTYRIAIVVAQKLIETDPDSPDGLDQAEVDGLMGVVQEIGEFCMALRLESPAAFPVAIETEPVYDAELLEGARLFAAPLIVSFRAFH